MIKLKIQKELLEMGFNPIHIGTEYLTEAIEIIYKGDKSIYKINLEKDIYENLAIKHKKKVQTIKSNIIKATNIVDMRNINEKNSIHHFDLKLTPKLVVWIVIRNIKNIAN